MRFCLSHREHAHAAMHVEGRWRFVIREVGGGGLGVSLGASRFAVPPDVATLLADLPEWPVMVHAHAGAPMRMYVSEIDVSGHMAGLQRLTLNETPQVEAAWRALPWGAELPEGTLDDAVWDVWAIARALWPAWDSATRKLLLHERLVPRPVALTHVRAPVVAGSES